MKPSRPATSGIWILLSIAALLPGGQATAEAPGDREAPLASLRPRALSGADAIRQPTAEQPAPRVIVKFHEGTRLRLRDGRLAVAARSERETARAAALGLDRAQILEDADEARRLAFEAPGGVGLSRLFLPAEHDLDVRRLAAERRSGRELADLNLYYSIELPPGTRYREVETLVTALRARPSIEVAYVPSPVRNAGFFVDRGVATDGVTPDFRALQGYRDPAPVGVDADYAWGIAGGRGATVKIMDIETRLGEPLFPVVHEDFDKPSPFEGVPPSGNPDADYCAEQHARAVQGELVGKDNDSGVAGIVPDASTGFESFFGQGYPGGLDVSTGLMRAADALQPGDVLLVEIELEGAFTPQGPCTTPCTSGRCGNTPVEFDQANFDAISMATAEGKIVIEPAGNGKHSLDDPNYQDIFDRNERDSGAVFVAASDPAQGPGVPACFTNFGSRIDVHSWGFDVVTTGYGDLHGCETDPPDCRSVFPSENCAGGLPATQRYTASFAGTSSASPIVAGAAASLLGAAEANLGQTLTPAEVLGLLVSTGTPPQPGTEIGPQPNLRTALDQLLQPNQPPEAEPDVLRLGTCPGNLEIVPSLLLANDSDPNGDPLELCGLPQPRYGTIVFSQGNQRFYVSGPETCTLGSDWLVYTVNDRRDCSGLSDTAVAMFVTPVDGPILLEDFFELGTLDAWASVFANGGNALTVSAKAALAGELGLEVSLAGGSSALLTDTGVAGESQFNGSFLLDPARVTLAAPHNLLTGRSATAPAFQIQLRQVAAGYEVRIRVWQNVGPILVSPWVALGAGPQRVEVEWWQSGLIRDPGVQLKIDGQVVATIFRPDVSGVVLGEIRFGATNANAASSGSYYLDDYRSWHGVAGP